MERFEFINVALMTTTKKRVFRIEASNREFKPIQLFNVRWDFPLFRLDNTPLTGAPNSPGARKYSAAEFLALIENEKPIPFRVWIRRLHKGRVEPISGSEFTEYIQG